MEDMITPLPRDAWVAGRPEQGENTRAVTHPHDGSEIATVALAGADQIERALAAAEAATVALWRAAVPRRQALEHASRALALRAEETAEVITAESAKPLRLAEAEVASAVATFGIAAEHARRLNPIAADSEADPDRLARLALTRRSPLGPALGLTPLDIPLAGPAHKLAAALAAGTPIIVRPDPHTPLSALLLGELLAETDLPDGAFSILPTGETGSSTLLADPRLPVVSFTGAGELAWSVCERVPHKRVTCELGGHAAAIVLGDCPDLDDAASKIAAAANHAGSRSGVTVREVIVADEMAETFISTLAEAVDALRTGDPHNPDVDVAGHLDADGGRAAAEWLSRAVDSGAKLLAGGATAHGTVAPTVLTDVPAAERASAQELAAPVLLISRASTAQEAFALADAADVGVPTGAFTTDIATVLRASVEGGHAGVIVGDVPSYRTMGLPHEGITEAIAELTERRSTVLTGITP